MQARLDGKTALVTGGSRGIGAAIAERLAADGAGIVFTYVGNSTAAGEVVDRIRQAGGMAEAIQADAARPDGARVVIDKAVAVLGGLDILVHNAGIAEFIFLADADEANYVDAQRRHFALNVDSVVALTKAALPHVRDGGRIIMIGSVNAHQMPFPGVALYGASKAAVAALARGWARDLGPRAILANVIQPGPINTDMNPDDGRDEVKHMTSMTALKRYGNKREIAAVAAFLASGESSYITGTTIDVDGGFSV